MIALAALLASPAPLQANAPLPSLVPAPAVMTSGTGTFAFGPDTRISVNRDSRSVGDLLRDELRPGTGLPLDLTTHTGRNMVVLRLDRRLSGLGLEGYRLDANGDQINIRAFGEAGLFYGAQTLRQLLPADTLRSSVKVWPLGHTWNVGGVHIEDQPRFAWRGAMLDVSRHFEPKRFLLRFIDLLALHKMNVFHIHLTDDQGWRVQIKKYPKLTEVGAWHKANNLTDDPTSWKTMPDGGFYTQDDLREVVAYAKDRFITVVPEIEMPGHSMGAIASYPELGNTGKQYPVPPVNGPSPDVLSASDHTVQFYQDVLTEVMDIFPSQFIHVGGDEVGKGPWKNNPEMQAKIKTLGLKNEEELQSWFIQQMDKFLSAHGRRLVGWDEILEGGLAQGAAVMSWRGINSGIAAAKAGHDVVMAPTDNTYLDYYQSTDHAHEPQAIGGFLPLAKVYSYEPIPDELTSDEAKHVLGAQCQLWTEYIPDARHVEYMAYPRLCALAEVTWSPKASRNFDGFLSRLKVHLGRLDALDVNYRPLDIR